MFDCGACCSSDKTYDTVKVDLSRVESMDKENVENQGDIMNGSMNGSLQQGPWPLQVEKKIGIPEQVGQEKEPLADEPLFGQAGLEESQVRFDPPSTGREGYGEEPSEQGRVEQEGGKEGQLEQERVDKDEGPSEQERLAQALREAEESRQKADAEAAARQEEASRAEEQKQAKASQDEQDEQARLAKEADAAALIQFLKKHGYRNANSKRTKMMKSKYPLHTAVKLKDADMIRVLLEAGADRSAKNSKSETPQQLADRLFSGDDDALALMQQAFRPA